MRKIFIVSILVALVFASCNKSGAKAEYGTLENGVGKVVFIELGAETCVPCQQMRPVMDKVVSNYSSDDVEVVYFDVWTDEEAHRIQEYDVRVIPTQVFLDKNGEIIFKHEGFMPYENVKEIIDSAL